MWSARVQFWIRHKIIANILREKNYLFTNFPLQRKPAKSHCSLKEQKKIIYISRCKVFWAHRFALRIFHETHLLESSVAEPEPRADEQRLNCLPEPELKLLIAAPAPAPAPALAPFYLPQAWRNFIEKKTWLLKMFLWAVTILILLFKPKKL